MRVLSEYLEFWVRSSIDQSCSAKQKTKHNRKIYLYRSSQPVRSLESARTPEKLGTQFSLLAARFMVGPNSGPCLLVSWWPPGTLHPEGD